MKTRSCKTYSTLFQNYGHSRVPTIRNCLPSRKVLEIAILGRPIILTYTWNS